MNKDWKEKYWKIIHEDGADYDKIEKFIQQKLDERDKSWKDKIEKLEKKEFPETDIIGRKISEMPTNAQREATMFTNGYNQAIEDIRNKLIKC